MDKFHINFHIFGKYGDFNSRLSCRHRSRKEKERKAAKREKRNGVGLANYISQLKNTPPLRVGVRFVPSGLIFSIVTAVLYIIPYVCILLFLNQVYITSAQPASSMLILIVSIETYRSKQTISFHSHTSHLQVYTVFNMFWRWNYNCWYY